MVQAYNFPASQQLFPGKGIYEQGETSKSGICQQKSTPNKKELLISHHRVTLENQTYASTYNIIADDELNDFEDYEPANPVQAILPYSSSPKIYFHKNGKVAPHVAHEIMPKGYSRITRQVLRKDDSPQKPLMTGRADFLFLLMTRLSVNINKFATLRNSRGGNNPDVVKAAIDAQRFGAEGVTVHPRPDERHIRYHDVREIKKIINTELNIEGNCTEQKFVDFILETKPDQVTLVPDASGQLTSDHGWDTIKHKDYLANIISVFKKAGIRVSIFVDPEIRMVEGAAAIKTDRIELYTEGYAKQFRAGSRESGVQPYVVAALKARELGLGLNAGHDLDLQNLKYFKQNIPWLDEVSIGHALVCDAIYLGFENAIQLYRRQLME